MKDTNHQKILRILREATGGMGMYMIFDTEYIRDHRIQKEKSHSNEQLFLPGFPGLNGGADGIRTRDLRRDRPAF